MSSDHAAKVGAIATVRLAEQPDGDPEVPVEAVAHRPVDPQPVAMVPTAGPAVMIGEPAGAPKRKSLGSMLAGRSGS